MFYQLNMHFRRTETIFLQYYSDSIALVKKYFLIFNNIYRMNACFYISLLNIRTYKILSL